MSYKILFIFEGEKKERQIVDNFANCFPNKNLIVQCAYCTTIYNLYNKISKDENLDTFSLLKENPKNQELYNRNDFAEIYLFFDYDGHTSSASDEKLKNILSFFNEETDFGKIYINYPMLESLKHYSYDIDFKELKVESKINIGYKKIVNKECNDKFIDFNTYTADIWSELIKIHLMKMNFITNDDYSLPKEKSSQEKIFSKQIEKYISVDSTVAVLNSFPIFLFEYYGIDKIIN